MPNTCRNRRRQTLPQPGAIVLTTTRTYHTGEHPAETADIVLPVERHALVYEIL
jgi:hypothetical protein